MNVLKLILKILHKLYFLFFYRQRTEFLDYVQLKNQDANDYIREQLRLGKPLLISKFGSIELMALLQHLKHQQKKYPLSDIVDYVTLRIPSLWWDEGINELCTNAGFFPNDKSLLAPFFDEYQSAMKQVDILGSYIYGEKFFDKELSGAKKINLDGYYAPFFWKNPWTSQLRNKKVLIVHPFAEDIEKQYAKRSKLWKDPDILPDFELKTYKAVQSMLNTKTEFNTWFDALEKMKKDISSIDFDIALVGCGAYGMPLAAHIKKMNKQVIHTAGWTQILFGIIGKRWEDDPRVSKFINGSWIRPSKNNIPQNSEKVEQGCYW